MRENRTLLIFIFLLIATSLCAADYPASLFGIRSDGSTLNTRSIQFAVDYIHEHGGGRLLFGVGRYLTGSFHLKSNVTLQLFEGAVLLGSLNPFDYDKEFYTALIFANNQENISITGNGIIEGNGAQVVQNVITLIHNGLMKDPLIHDRPLESNRPMLIYFRDCTGVVVKGITLSNAASWVQTYDQCKNIFIDSIWVDSKAFWNNDGVDIVDSRDVIITNSYVDAADDGICLKSQDSSVGCHDILIRKCTIRSSANAIKFGTTSYGGFTHIRIINNKVFDTYRSALALEAVDGGYIDDITVDSLQVFHSGNALFLRLGERSLRKMSSLRNVRISNLSVDIASGKPDSGYAYEGPIEDQPRNISPIVITGLPGMFIENISFRNISVSYPGGGNTFIANRSLNQLDSIPELVDKYPEFSMFKELPAWGLYIRHARNLKFENINLACTKKDYRMAIVMDDVRQVKIINSKINGDFKKGMIYKRNSSEINFY